MENLKIYKIKEKYVRYLNSRDSKVQFNKNQKRPYVGIVFRFAGYNYFVPMESPKPNHKNIKRGKHIIKLDGGQLGILGFNNMIPVPKEALVEFNFAAEEDEKYQNLLRQQHRACNKIKADILDHAQRTYFDVVNNKNEFLVKISCDFKKLERACKEYKNDYKPKK